MAQRKKKEEAWVTFHVITKGKEDKKGNFKPGKFSQKDFNALVSSIRSQPLPNLRDKTQLDEVRRGKLIPFYELRLVNKKTLVGVYEGAYSGHSYKNSEKGKIEARSVNQRRFCFLLYLSVDGRIYVGAQYLGMYGAYTDLRDYLIRELGVGAGYRAKSIRKDAEVLKDAVPIELRVDVRTPSTQLGKAPALGTRSALAYHRHKEGDQFQNTVANNLLSWLGQPEAAMKKQIANIVSESETYEIDEDQIEGCSVVVQAGKGTRVLYLLGENNKATKFHLNVPFDDRDGLPRPVETGNAMLKVLKESVLK